MKYRKIFTLLTVFLLGLASVQAADTYQIDAAHTTAGFSVKHMVINTVHGRFTDLSGTILLDESDMTKSSANVTIKATSIDTGVAGRDNDLRSANFFDVAQYPTITFASRRVEKQGSGFVLIGDLTMHGVTKEVAISFTFNGKIKDPRGTWRIGCEGQLTINRQDWGISYNRAIDTGGLVVGNDVKIELSVEAVQK